MITAIEAQKRNKDKVNLYLDGEFACSLTAESVVRARLKIGQELSEERLREILATSETELAFKKALDYIAGADVLIIGGTSLVVYPAAGLVRYYRGNKLVVINRDATGMDSAARLCISAPIGQVLGQL